MLRRLFSFLFVFLITIGLFIHDAEAKRFGGGRSFGMQRSTSTFNRSAPPPASSGFMQNKPGLNQLKSSASKWLGPLAGLAAGGLLASLFMHNGIGSGLLSWLLIGGGLLLIFSFIRSRMQPVAQPQYQDGNNRNQFTQEAMSQFMRNNSQAEQSFSSTPIHSYPAGFDATAFLRDAKVQFIRLQAAYDQKNLNDLREFTSPEVYAEIQLQFQERGNEHNQTDVINLDAELLDVTAEPERIADTEMQAMVTSVRFSGFIQENRNEPAASFNEIWHFKKEISQSRWIVIGIQQN